MRRSSTPSEASTRPYPLVVSSTPITRQDEAMGQEANSLDESTETHDSAGALAPRSDPPPPTLQLDGIERHGASGSTHSDHQQNFTKNPLHGGTSHQRRDYRYPAGSPPSTAPSFNISPPMYAPPAMLPLPHAMVPSHSGPPPYPRLRYPSVPTTPFQTAPPVPYVGQTPNPQTPVTGMVFFTLPDKRYAPMYHYPYNPHMNAHGHPLPQPESQGQIFYPVAYPHSFPQSPTTSGGNTTPTSPPNANAASTAHWPHLAPQIPYNYNHSPFHYSGAQPMQHSSSQHNARTTSQHTFTYNAAPPYIRRHSHPVKQLPSRINAPETDQSHEHGWIVRQKPYVSPGQQNFRSQNHASSSMNMQNFGDATRSTTKQSSLPVKVLSSPLPSATTMNPVLPRGPPRKPRQSGHALWVGNLPPGTTVIELKDNFSSGATDTIESVFLISKSNCAFINYKTDTACGEAMGRFHDSRFKGVRLVCRLRRNSSNSPAAKADATDGEPAVVDGEQDGAAVEAPVDGASAQESSSLDRKYIPVGIREKLKDRVFIFKSLTVEDLDLSVKNGVWATQSHNEEALNRAFETSENVYLIFSANKSGEYYGYARMSSKIPDESIQDIQWSHTANTKAAQQAVGAGGLRDALLPKSIFTPATATAPAGRIIDDSARGTIFWEVDGVGGGAEGNTEVDLAPSTVATEDGEELGSDAKAWGKPFRVEWISTSKIPFYKTRGLRNAWNSNREVKIARDGTEVESNVGKRLLQMFHRGVNVPARPQHANSGMGGKQHS